MKTYFIVQYFGSSGVTINLADTNDPAEAYEMAHAWDANIHLGVHDWSEVLNHDKNSIIYILDKDGNNCWHECCEARCPSVGLFNSVE